MRAFFLRHGQSISNADLERDAISADSGDRLTDIGIRQAQAAADGLREVGITRLYASPLTRARETAEPISEALGLEPIKMTAAHEIVQVANYGVLSPEEQRLQRWSEQMYAHRVDPEFSTRGSESFNGVLNRVREVKRELENLPEGELPLVVSHGMFMRFLLFETLLGSSFSPAITRRMWHIRTVNCGLSLFERGERWHPVDAETPGWTCITWMARPWDTEIP